MANFLEDLVVGKKPPPKLATEEDVVRTRAVGGNPLSDPNQRVVEEPGGREMTSEELAAKGDPALNFSPYVMGPQVRETAYGTVIQGTDPYYAQNQMETVRQIGRLAGDRMTGTAGAQAAEGYIGGQALYDTAAEAGAVGAQYGETLADLGAAHSQNIQGAAGEGMRAVMGAGAEGQQELTRGSASRGVKLIGRGEQNAQTIAAASGAGGERLIGQGEQMVRRGTAATTGAMAGARAVGETGRGLIESGQQTTGEAVGTARELTGLEATEGPSAAQAQLRSATNQANRSAMALARSGRGWGQQASSLRTAQVQQAAQTQEAANESARLRAQETAQWRARQAANLGTATQALAGIGQAQTGTGVAARTSGANIMQNVGATQSELGAGQTRAGVETGVAGVRDAATMSQQATSEGIQMAQRGAEQSAQMGVDTAATAAGLGVRAAEGAAQTQIGATAQGAGAAMTGVQTRGNLQQAGAGTVQTGLAGSAATDVGVYNAYMGGEQAAHGVALNQAELQRAAQLDILQRYAIENNVSMQQAALDLQQQGALIAGGATLGAATIQALSDERAKENIEPAKADVFETFLNVEPSAFDYKDPAHGEGRFWGLMAQDLEKTKAGASVVEEDAGIKKLNLPKLNMLTAAGLGALAQEVVDLKRQVEKRKRRRAN